MRESDHCDYRDIRLTDEELDEIREEIDRGGDHAWGFRLQAAIVAAIRRKTSKRLGPYGDWPKDGH